MDKKENIKNLAGMVRVLFEKTLGGFQAEDFHAVARELGFDVVDIPGSGEEIGYTYHQQQQPGEGFCSIAPGAGDISEGMVWASKKSSI